MREIKQVIIVRKDLNMRKGKIAAQVAHASVKSITDRMEKSVPLKWYLPMNSSDTMTLWLTGIFTKVVLGVESKSQLFIIASRAAEAGIQITPIEDEGKTEFGNVKTFTCVAIGPDYSDKIDEITEHLKLI